MTRRPARWPDTAPPWPAALSFGLHAAVLAAVLILAAAPPVPAPPPPAIIVEMIEAAGMAGGGGGAASPAARPAEGEAAGPPQPVVPAVEAAALPRLPRTEAVRRPKRPPTPPAARTQETSSAAKSVASEATTGVTQPVTAAGDDQSGGATGSGRGQAPAGDGAGRAADMEAYLAALRQAIQRGLIYPATARRLGLAGLVRVRFLVLADGRVDPGSLVVTGGSDDDILRRGALDTIRRLSTFSPPPVGSIGVEVPVNFTLTQ